MIMVSSGQLHNNGQHGRDSVGCSDDCRGHNQYFRDHVNDYCERDHCCRGQVL